METKRVGWLVLAVAVLIGTSVAVTLLVTGDGVDQPEESTALAESAPAEAEFHADVAGSECAKPVVEPKRIVLACADAGAVAKHLHWSHWGEAVTSAAGTVTLNDCLPDCASGSYTDYPARVILFGVELCPDNSRQYTKLAVEYGQGAPQRGTDSIGSYPCG